MRLAVPDSTPVLLSSDAPAGRSPDSRLYVTLLSDVAENVAVTLAVSYTVPRLPAAGELQVGKPEYCTPGMNIPVPPSELIT